MKICMQLPFRPPFAHANFQLGRKGQRPKGRKVKGQNFKKLAEAILTLFQALCIGFTSFLVLKMVIVEDLVVSVHCVAQMQHRLAYLIGNMYSSSASNLQQSRG